VEKPSSYRAPSIDASRRMHGLGGAECSSAGGSCDSPSTTGMSLIEVYEGNIRAEMHSTNARSMGYTDRSQIS
jgi:hypothetical protein